MSFDRTPFVEAAIGNSGGWTAEKLARIPEFKQKIVEGLRTGRFLSDMCIEIGVSRVAVGNWKQGDPEFREACAEAEEAWLDKVEGEAYRRAVHGYDEPVIQGGKVVLDPSVPVGETPRPFKIRRYSDSLLALVLKGRRREVYGERTQVDATVRADVEGVRAALAAKLAAVAGTAAEAGSDGESEPGAG